MAGQEDRAAALETFVSELPKRLDATAAAGGEHRLVTALFADVSGFTQLATRLDPEDLLELIDPVIRALSTIVARYDGYVEKFAGDALLALFGAPVSHDDDAARALLTALEMHRELAGLREALPDGASELALHIGVNSGHGIARVISTEARVDYAVLGESVILAQRLESAAPPGETYVSDSTYRLARDRFEFEPLEALAVKGREEPVVAWRLLGERQTRRRRLTPLVGREQELASARARVEALTSGEGSLVAVLGEPGIGKSRLLGEIRTVAEGLGARWLEARCLSYGGALPYWPYADVVRRLAGIEADEPPDRALVNLAETLASRDLADTAPFLARLLGLPEAGPVPSDPDAFRTALHRAIGSLLAVLGAEQPLVFAVEDLHWADESSTNLTADLAEIVLESPILLFLSGREEASEAVERVSQRLPAERVVRLPLRALGDADIAPLVENILRGGAPAGLVEFVRERAGGNPFFCEELIRSLQESAVVAHDNGIWQLAEGWDAISVPLTIEGVLSARIDLLPQAAAALLQTAAVVGRRVRVRLLDAVAGDGMFGPSLARLIAAGFLDPVEDEREDVLAFHHWVVQEVAYSRLLRRQQRELHLRVANAAEELYGSGDDVIEVLARHLDLAEAGLKAAEYLFRAAERARHLYANDDAIDYYERALVRLSRLSPEAAPAAQRAELEATINEAHGDVLTRIGRRTEALDAYGRARSALGEDTTLEAARLRGKQAMALQLDYRWDESLAAYDEAEAMLGGAPSAAEELGWWNEWIKLQLNRASVHYWRGEPDQIDRLAEKVRPAVERHGTAAQRASFFHTLVTARNRANRFVISDEVIELAEAARAAEEESGDAWEIGIGAFSYGFQLLWKGRFDDAQVALEDSLAFAERSGAAATRCRCLTYLTVLARRRGDVHSIERYATLALEAAEALEMWEYAGAAHANLAWLDWRRGRNAAARGRAAHALELWRQEQIAYPFWWMALWPLLAISASGGQVEEALGYARDLLAESQQPLPPTIARELERALQSSDPLEQSDLLTRGVKLALDHAYL